MNRQKLAIKSSIIGVLSQITSLITKFVVRTFAIRYLGMEILGLDSVLIDTISMLSLAELGITTAMLYRMYTPVIDSDINRIQTLMATYKFIYRIIAVCITVLGVCISFALPYIVKEINLSWGYIYIAFYLQLFCTVSSYLFAYQRILLNANQKNYLCSIVDTILLVIFSVLKIIAIILVKSYPLYLLLTALQTIVANQILRWYSKSYYPYLKKYEKASKEDIKCLMRDTKDIFSGRIAGYIYNSTDNLIISTVLGTATVGLLSNYKYISTSLRGLINSAMQAMQPLLGIYLNSNTTKEQSYKILQRYSFVRFVLAGISVVPFVCCADIFVKIWSGHEEYVMPVVITLLLAIDYYISCVFGPLGDYIVGLGMFRQEKYITVIGGISNLLLSVIGVYTWGISGILIATVISQFIMWIGKVRILFNGYFDENNSYKRDYIREQIGYCFITVFSISISYLIFTCVKSNILWRELIARVVISEICYVMTFLIVYHKTEDFKYFKSLFLKFFQK